MQLACVIILCILVLCCAYMISKRDNEIKELKIIIEQYSQISKNEQPQEINKQDDKQEKQVEEPTYKIKNMNALLSKIQHLINQHEYTNFWLFVMTLELGAIIYFFYYFYSIAIDKEKIINMLLDELKKYF